MREILFRGKRIGNGEWVEGHLVESVTGTVWIFKSDYCKPLMPNVDPTTVGQYTGLRDKNGKRIFEGDIIKFRTRTSDFITPLYVRWYEEDARFIVSLYDGIRSYPMYRSWEYEVIGNITDNPEFLKEVRT